MLNRLQDVFKSFQQNDVKYVELTKTTVPSLGYALGIGYVPCLSRVFSAKPYCRGGRGVEMRAARRGVGLIFVVGHLAGLRSRS